MRVHANILDAILDTPSSSAMKTASSSHDNVGDLFLDSEFSGRTSIGVHSKRAASPDLDEAFTHAAEKEAAAQKDLASKHFASIEAAVRFASSLHPKDGQQLPSKVASLYAKAKEAGDRLARLAAKTPDQMDQDGASKIADYLDPLLVPAWARQASADMALLQGLRNIVPTAKIKQASDTSFRPKAAALGEDVKSYIRDLLTQGVTPRAVYAKLEKMADLQLFDKGLSTNYLNDNAGLLGLGYIEPNHYMNDCNASAKRLEVKVGGTKAASVRQIAACVGCKSFSRLSGTKHCNLYRLPIVANQAELLPILNNLTGGAPDKRAALVRIANHDDQRHTAKVQEASSAYSRTASKADVRHGGSNGIIKTTSTEFDVDMITTLHKAGNSLHTIYTHGVKLAGATQARRAVQDFVGTLNRQAVRIDLTQIDCSVLGSKLGSKNSIIGAKKCGSCTFRHGMHCGFTGGTLVAFPGMDKASKTASFSGSQKDGHALLNEFELTQPTSALDIRLNKANGNVELTSTSKVNL